MKYGIKHYWKSTPPIMRKIGDGLLAVSTFVSGFAMTYNHKWIAISGLIAGVLGKFLTNFFAIGENENNLKTLKND